MNRLSLLIIFALTLLASAVSAETPKAIPPQARTLYKAGFADYNVGRFVEALVKFEKAAKLVAHPTIILALAQCHRQLDRPEKALFFYRLYQSKVAENARYADVQDQVSRLEKLVADRKAAALARSAVAKVSLSGLIPGAEIYVDGSLRGQAPMTKPLELSPGTHTLEARVTGRVTWRRTLHVQRGSQQTLQVELTKPSLTEAPPAARAPRERSTAWLIAGIATSALAVGAEIGAIVLTMQANDQLAGSSAYTSRRNAAIGLHVVAGAAVVGAVVSWVFYARSGGERRGPQVAVVPLTEGGALVGGTFRF